VNIFNLFLVGEHQGDPADERNSFVSSPVVNIIGLVSPFVVNRIGLVSLLVVNINWIG
jgi:hypothetical protein